MVRGILIGVILLSGMLLIWSVLPLFSTADMMLARSTEPLVTYRAEIILASATFAIAAFIGVLIERRKS